jgi:hypothetical protein
MRCVDRPEGRAGENRCCEENRHEVHRASASRYVSGTRLFASVGYRSPLVGCSFQNLLASNALAEDAIPARTDRASSAEITVFTIVLRTPEHSKAIHT